MCLMNGVDPACMTAQFGHDQSVFFSDYARWIEGKANKRHLAKVDAAITPICAKRASAGP